MDTKEQKLLKLNRLLHRGVIKNERDFMLFYGFCDNMLTSHKAPHTVIMEIHLFEGYCQLEVKVNPFCKYSSSFKAFYEHSNNLTIFFYNYYDQPVCFGLWDIPSRAKFIKQQEPMRFTCTGSLLVFRFSFILTYIRILKS